MDTLYEPLNLNNYWNNCRALIISDVGVSGLATNANVANDFRSSLATNADVANDFRSSSNLSFDVVLIN